MKKRRTIVVLVCLFIISILLAVYVGQVKISPSDLILTLFGNGTSSMELILFQFRLPRIIVCILIGIGMALAGCTLQSVLKNDLADPSILGINSGASFFVLIYVVLFSTNQKYSVVMMPLLALIGGLLAAGIIYLLTYRKGKDISKTRIILTGVAINTGFQAAILFMTLLLDRKQFAFVQLWSAGSIFGDEWRYIMVLFPWVFVFSSVIFYLSRKLDVLQLSDITATGLGVNVPKTTLSFLALSVGLSAGCVAVGGSIMFVGILAPHMARKLVGNNHKILLPTCALIGSIFLLLSDTIGRSILNATEIPAGIVVSIIGAPYFLYQLMKSI